MIRIPESVELDGNEEAYVRGALRKIANNARKTTSKRYHSDPEFKRLLDYIEKKAHSGFSKFFNDMQKALEEKGKLTERQEAACMKILREDDARKAEMRARDAGSQFVGEIKVRQTFTLQVTGYALREGSFGETHLHFMKDDAGNVVIYKGSKKIADKGDRITIKASVKKHEERDGVKQTFITRAVITEAVAEANEVAPQPTKSTSAKYDYPAGMTDAQKKAYRAKMRRQR